MSSLETPTVEGRYRIMPSDIDATQPFLRAFGKAEVEHVALGLILYCQDKGGWVPFTEAELTAHFRTARAAGRTFEYRIMMTDEDARTLFGPDVKVRRDAYDLFMSSRYESTFAGGRPDEFKFYWLSPEEGLLVRKGEDSKYRATELFIERCFKASPVRW